MFIWSYKSWKVTILLFKIKNLYIIFKSVIILDKILDCEYHSPINTSPILIEAPFLRKLETTIQRVIYIYIYI